MTTAAELVSAPAATPPFDIVRAAYVELARHRPRGVASVSTSTCSASSSTRANRRHALPARLGGAAAPLARAAPGDRRGCRAPRLPGAPRGGPRRARGGARAHGLRGRVGARRLSRGMGRALRVWDPFGFPLEFFHEMAQVETQLQRFDLHRGAPIIRIDHFNLHSPAASRRRSPSGAGLGFRCSEYISTDGVPTTASPARGCCASRRVHDVALTAGRGPRLHHLGILGRRAGRRPAGLRPARRGGHWPTRSSAGPAGTASRTRSSSTSAIPDGHRIELYTCDYYTGDPDHQPLRWSVADPRCRSFWGTARPTAGTRSPRRVLGPDGEIVATEDATIDERDQHTEVMV